MTFNSEPSDGFCRCAYGKQCPKGSQCLRSQAWEQPEESALQAVALRLVNIKCEKIKIMTDECSMFVSNQKKRIAIGITHLLYNVPYKNTAQ